MYPSHPSGPPELSNYTGDINYGTHWRPTQLRIMLEASVGMQWHWADLLNSPYSYPTSYEYGGPSLGSAGFSFGHQAQESALAQVIFSGQNGDTGVTTLENLRPLQGPAGPRSLEWHGLAKTCCRTPQPLESQVQEMAECWSEAPESFSAWGDQAPTGTRPACLPPEMSL